MEDVIVLEEARNKAKYARPSSETTHFFVILSLIPLGDTAYNVYEAHLSYLRYYISFVLLHTYLERVHLISCSLTLPKRIQKVFQPLFSHEGIVCLFVHMFECIFWNLVYYSFVGSFVQEFSNVVMSPRNYDIIPFPRLSAKSNLQIEGILKQFEFRCNDCENSLL